MLRELRVPRFTRRAAATALCALVACAACAAGARGAAAAADTAPGLDEAGTTAPRLERWAFTAFWDPRSRTSLGRHGRALDVAVTTWIALDSTTAAPTVLHAAPHARGGPARTMALVTSWHGDRFHPGSVRRLAGDRARLDAAAAEVARRVAALGHAGLVLDFEGHVAADTGLLRQVTAAFARAARAAGAGPVSVAIPATDTLAYPGPLFVAAGARWVLPMLYDQHWTGGEAGPVAAPAWARQWLAVRVREVGADHVVAGLPFYGYHWPAPKRGRTVTHAEAVALARGARGGLVRDSASGTLRARVDSGEVWVTDAVVVRRLLEEARRAGVRRVAFWHMGQEDPAVWRMLGAR